MNAVDANLATGSDEGGRSSKGTPRAAIQVRSETAVLSRTQANNARSMPPEMGYPDLAVLRKRKIFAAHGSPSSLQDKIREYVVSLIDGGQYLPGDRLPTEQDFVKQLCVSLAPVRIALNQLVQSGLIVRHRGKGSFVREPPAVFRVELPGSITGSLRDAAIDFEVEVVDRTIRKAPPEICNVLRLGPRGTALYLRRLFLHHNEPIVLSATWVAFEAARAAIEKTDFSGGASLYRTLAESGVRVTGTTAEIDVYQSSQDVAELMALSFGAPLLQWKTWGSISDGTVIEASTNHFNTRHLRVVIGETARNGLTP